MKVLIAHPAQQHSYELATALKRAGHTVVYSTTVYYKKRNMTSIFAALLKGDNRKRAESRNCASLLDNEVVQFAEGFGLLKLLCSKVSFLKKYYENLKYFTADIFAKRVARFVLKNEFDVIITYDDSSPILFEILKKNNYPAKRVLDMSAANLLYMKEIYEEDLKLAPTFAKRLLLEKHLVWDKKIQKRAQKEIDLSDYFMVPSEFVMRSLKYSGVRDEQFIRCTYGVDISKFLNKERINPPMNPLKFVYVGGVKELKGIYYLLEAFKQISTKSATLTIVGSADINSSDLLDYREFINFTGVVMHERVAEILHESDVYIFPSLGEGLSLSTLEAASCGLPLIVSDNSGLKDLLTDGKEGFCVPIQSVEALVDRINWFIDNKDLIPQMSKNARAFAEKFTWEYYYSCVKDAFNTKIKEWNDEEGNRNSNGIF